jgi:hypothetical protein
LGETGFQGLDVAKLLDVAKSNVHYTRLSAGLWQLGLAG